MKTVPVNLEMDYGRITEITFRPRQQAVERYESNEGGVFYETCFREGPQDTSPRHNINDGYDPACSCCWLHFTHSERAHRARGGGRP